MTRPAVTWLAGDPSPELRTTLERALAAGLSEATLLQESVHRSVHRIEPCCASDCASDSAPEPTLGSAPGATALALKIHHGATGRHRVREALKRFLQRSPARLEWRAQTALFQAGVAVAAPRAWGRLANGDEILVSDFLSGSPPSEIRDPAARSGGPSPQLVDSIADAVGALHRAGFRHGDLHLGNLQLVDGRIHLLDLQRARPIRSPRDRLWDLARLELSLARAGWTPAARMALRDRLGVGPEFDRILRRFLRDHLRGRARRVLRPGRQWARVRLDHRRGLRETALAESDLVAILATTQAAEASEAAGTAHPEPASQTRRRGRVRIQTVESGGRTLVVKCFEVGLSRRALADLVRGAPAARAFRRGQAHRLLVHRTARPLAYLEQSRFGLPIRSWLVMEQVGELDLDAYRPASPELAHRIASRLGQWLADGHAWGLAHHDLKGSNLRIERAGDAIRFWLIDLEDLSKGPVELSRKARLVALAQLNASLADEAFDGAARLAALEHYRARLPFSTDASGTCDTSDTSDASDASDLRGIAGEIARRSLTRGHRWRGQDCDCLAAPDREGARDGSSSANPVRPGSP